MKTDEKDKEVDINEVAITLEVEAEVIDKVRSGEITPIRASCCPIACGSGCLIFGMLCKTHNRAKGNR